jgi:thioredoxin 1
MVAPILEEIAREYSGKLIVVKVNTDENPTWAMQYGVRGIPTMLFIKNGEEIDRQVGAVPKQFIANKLSAILA